jgi:hypothetical protein
VIPIFISALNVPTQSTNVLFPHHNSLDLSNRNQLDFAAIEHQL